jgi:oligoribonuclease (3'-5' exoribonuclease)
LRAEFERLNALCYEQVPLEGVAKYLPLTQETVEELNRYIQEVAAEEGCLVSENQYSPTLVQKHKTQSLEQLARYVAVQRQRVNLKEIGYKRYRYLQEEPLTDDMREYLDRWYEKLDASGAKEIAKEYLVLISSERREELRKAGITETEDGHFIKSHLQLAYARCADGWEYPYSPPVRTPYDHSTWKGAHIVQVDDGSLICFTPADRYNRASTTRPSDEVFS